MVKITKLPPGEAEGARDLRDWGHRRQLGRSGVRKEKTKAQLDMADRWLAQHDKKTKAQLREEAAKLSVGVKVWHIGSMGLGPDAWMSEEEHRARVKSYLERGGKLPWEE